MLWFFVTLHQKILQISFEIADSSKTSLKVTCKTELNFLFTEYFDIENRKEIWSIFTKFVKSAREKKTYYSDFLPFAQPERIDRLFECFETCFFFDIAPTVPRQHPTFCICETNSWFVFLYLLKGYPKKRKHGENSSVALIQQSIIYTSNKSSAGIAELIWNIQTRAVQQRNYYESQKSLLLKIRWR